MFSLMRDIGVLAGEIDRAGAPLRREEAEKSAGLVPA